MLNLCDILWNFCHTSTNTCEPAYGKIHNILSLPHEATQVLLSQIQLVSTYQSFRYFSPDPTFYAQYLTHLSRNSTHVNNISWEEPLEEVDEAGADLLPMTSLKRNNFSMKMRLARYFQKKVWSTYRIQTKPQGLQVEIVISMPKLRCLLRQIKSVWLRLRYVCSFYVTISSQIVHLLPEEPETNLKNRTAGSP